MIFVADFHYKLLELYIQLDLMIVLQLFYLTHNLLHMFFLQILFVHINLLLYFLELLLLH